MKNFTKELLDIKENTLPTLNEKIYRAQVREYDFKEINELMDPLVHLAVCVDKVRTVKLMKEIVPDSRVRIRNTRRWTNNKIPKNLPYKAQDLLPAHSSEPSAV